MRWSATRSTNCLSIVVRLELWLPRRTLLTRPNPTSFTSTRRSRCPSISFTSAARILRPSSWASIWRTHSTQWCSLHIISRWQILRAWSQQTQKLSALFTWILPIRSSRIKRQVCFASVVQARERVSCWMTCLVSSLRSCKRVQLACSTTLLMQCLQAKIFHSDLMSSTSKAPLRTRTTRWSSHCFLTCRSPTCLFRSVMISTCQTFSWRSMRPFDRNSANESSSSQRLKRKMQDNCQVSSAQLGLVSLVMMRRFSSSRSVECTQDHPTKSTAKTFLSIFKKTLRLKAKEILRNSRR